MAFELGLAWTNASQSSNQEGIIKGEMGFIMRQLQISYFKANHLFQGDSGYLESAKRFS